MSDQTIVLTGEATASFAASLAGTLQASHKVIERSSFADGEICFALADMTAARDVVVVGDLRPVDDAVLFTLFILKELQDLGVGSVTLVLPYLSYNRQDKRGEEGKALLSKHLISMIADTGIGHVVCIGIHNTDTLNYFTERAVPVTHVEVLPAVAKQLVAAWGKEVVVIAPDKGSEKLAEACAVHFQAKWIVMPKVRDLAGCVNRTEAVDISSVHNKNVVIVDDMIDTAGTIASACKLLKEAGANQVYAFATHGIFSGPALDRLHTAGFAAVAVTDTLPSQVEVFHAKGLPLIVCEGAAVVGEILQELRAE